MTTNSGLVGAREETLRAPPIRPPSLSAQTCAGRFRHGAKYSVSSYSWTGLGRKARWVPWVLWKSFRWLVLNPGMLGLGSRVRFAIQEFRGGYFRPWSGAEKVQLKLAAGGFVHFAGRRLVVVHLSLVPLCPKDSRWVLRIRGWWPQKVAVSSLDSAVNDFFQGL